MFATLLNLSLLALALPTALAGYHGNPIMYRHPHGLAKRAEGHVELFKRVDNARWSFYNAETGNAGSCGQMLSNSGFTVAMNVAQMNSGLCYQTITMSYGGKTTTATIVDTCPGCPWGGLDLTPGLFSFFASQGAGIIYGTWNFGSGAVAQAPAPTTTWKPAPTPTTTWKPATTPTPTPTPTPKPTTTTSTSSKPSSSSHPSSSASSSASSSSSVSYSSNGLATPTGTINVTPGQPENLANLILAFVEMGSIAMAGSKL